MAEKNHSIASDVSQKPSVANTAPDAPAQASRPPRIDAIPLFGSQQLARARDGRTWVFTTASTKPERLTRRESMFINAALNMIRGQ